jgi:hypothetical protein
VAKMVFYPINKLIEKNIKIIKSYLAKDEYMGLQGGVLLG